MAVHLNQGWYQNLWVELDDDSRNLDLEVRLVCRFSFHEGEPMPPNSHPWTGGEETDWKARFIELVEERWSYQYPLLADFADNYEPGDRTMSRTIDPRRFTADLPGAQVALKIIDVDSPPARLTIPSGHEHQIFVWRQRDPGGAHGSAATRSSALHESALETLAMPGGYRQTAALHEVGHLIGLVHPGCPTHVQTSHTDLGAMGRTECYGRDGTQRSSIMGSGDVIGAPDYVVFAYIMQRLRPEWVWFAGAVRAQSRGRRIVSLERGLISPTQDAVGPTPGVLTRGAIYPSLSVRESRGLA
jgi:hypothetical protein